MNGGLRIVLSDLGRMLRALSVMMFVSLSVPLLWGEYYTIPALFLAGLITLGIGTLLSRQDNGDGEKPGKLHGMIIAAAGWFLVALFGALPFLFTAWTIHLDPGLLGQSESAASPTIEAFRDPLNSVFESMSGFTGTGLTMTDHENELPHTLQWWRSFTQWIGGVGVIVLTTAILSRPGSGSLTLYESEARQQKIHPSIVTTVRTIWWIFVLFTFVSIALLWLVGMPLWDAINHGMTALATGGYSVTDNSIATYGSVLIESVLVPIMILGSIAFPVHYLILQGDLRNFYRDLQTRWVFVFSGVGVLVLTALLVHSGTYGSVAEAARFGVFQFVSAATCTGFGSADLGSGWSSLALLTVSVGMFVGGAAGSTAGGIKLIRLLTLGKGMVHQVTSVFYPQSAIRRFEIDGRVLSAAERSREFEEAAIIALLWIVFLTVGLVGLLILLPEETSLASVIFEIASTQGNVGLSTGITGPSLPSLAKLLMIFNMWIGRLEIIPVLVLLRVLLRGGDRP